MSNNYFVPAKNGLDFIHQQNQGKRLEKEDSSLKFHKETQIRAHHEVVTNAILKAVEMCPMDQRHRMIIRFRVWGCYHDIFAPMTVEQIVEFVYGRGLDEEMRQKRVMLVETVEREAVDILKDYFDRFSLGDVIGRYNHAQPGGNVLYDAKGKPVTGH